MAQNSHFKQNRLGFGIRELFDMSKELLSSSQTTQNELFPRIEELATVTELSRQLFALRLQARVKEVYGHNLENISVEETNKTIQKNKSAHTSIILQFPIMFSIGKKIGEGSFGRVFQGQRLANGNYVAIKVIEKPNEESDILMVQDERNLLAALRNHPFVLQFECSLNVKGHLLLLTELALGNLRDLLKQQPGKYLAENIAQFYIAQIVRFHCFSFCYSSLG